MNDFPFVIKEFRFIFWAYNLIWLLLAAYLTFLLVRMNRLTREIGRLEGESRGPNEG